MVGQKDEENKALQAAICKQLKIAKAINAANVEQ